MSLLKPDFQIDKITNIPISYFQMHNLTLVLIDLDNTIINPSNNQMIDNLNHWLALLNKENISTCFVSNRLINDTEKLAKKLKSRIIINALKPLSKGLKEAIEDLNIPSNEICLIGDQTFTDVLGGNLIGLHTIKVEPICEQEDKLSSFCRLLEKYYFYLDEKFNQTSSVKEKTHYLKKN